jgi:hypothetical protein
LRYKRRRSERVAFCILRPISPVSGVACPRNQILARQLNQLTGFFDSTNRRPKINSGIKSESSGSKTQSATAYIRTAGFRRCRRLREEATNTDSTLKY